MAKTRSMTKNQNNGNASRTKKIKICDNGGVAPWSDLADGVLLLVMMQLGVIDFLAFRGVFKSWRSLALSNKNKFMASKPPMFVCTSSHSYKNACYLEDFEGRKLKTILPPSAGRTCIGGTCGYLILYCKNTRDFWLVNPITRHELHLPDVPLYVFRGYEPVRAILVYSPSLSEWVFVIADTFYHEIWFSIVGKREWTHVSTPFIIHDVHAFKGKIYTLLRYFRQEWHLCEVRLFSKPNLTLLVTKKFQKLGFYDLELASYDQKLYVVDPFFIQPIYEIDFEELKWVSLEKTREEYTFFHNNYLKRDTAVIPYHRSEYGRYELDTKKGGKGRFLYANMWHFVHDCLDVNHLHD
ncbi:unnamed protein product [Lactuca virosa]|uniref:F-box domain-containing protein n=1 Tax=Lactuca virosa TaxID=75947 RepID=A0AAU9PIJ6_9ASTR|nr:unnamed protein product [Lactuca virosa]